MKITFPYEEKLIVDGKIKRPIADVYFWSKLTERWNYFQMVVDSGADYTILPLYALTALKINPDRECMEKITVGVGGQIKVWVLKEKIKIKIGDFELKIPVGFIDSNNVPPLLGREGCLNLFRVLMNNFQTEISQ